MDRLSVLHWSGDCFMIGFEDGSYNKNADLAVEEGDVDHLYKNLPIIFGKYSSAEGFLIVHDERVLNYWNLVQANRSKLWITDKVNYFPFLTLRFSSDKLF